MTPERGMHCTILYLTDRVPAEVIWVSKGGRKMVIREMAATRTDKNGMSESQTFEYASDPNGKQHTCHRGERWRASAPGLSRGPLVELGIAKKYHDFSF